ncbi:hypothetical protein ACIRD2_13790 [Streptomyces sp. NPDC093595]|jgi:hypothetical protein|uniref:hypothetical protein n=1 Tax=unclassified Streptomyces TaxID=2593676 RepID=UPI003798722C
MSRRLALVLTAVTIFFTALATPASAIGLPPISGPLSDLQIEGPLIQTISLPPL